MAGAAAASLISPAEAASYSEGVSIGITRRQRRNIRLLAEAFLTDHGAPGLSVAYAENGTITYSAAFGLADETQGERLTPDHRFRIASISKPITAAAIMLLIENGDLTPNSTVFGGGGILNRRFPLPKGAPNRSWLKSITIDHLLTHTCGGWTNDISDPMFLYPAKSVDFLINKTLADAPLLNLPGTVYAYSNFGYCLLGRVIEEISGESYDRYVRRNILRPAGAGGMRISGNTLADRKRREVVYKSQEATSAYGMNVARMDSHGGWIATASDLVKFARRVDGYAVKPDIIKPVSVNLMRTPTVANAYYGHGWTINPAHLNRWHTGSLPGTTSNLVLVDGGNCFAGLVNTRTFTPDIGVGLDTLMWAIYAEVTA